MYILEPATSRRNARSPVTSLKGVTLFELLMFIVIVSVGLAGVLAAYNTVSQKSADPLVRKQLTAVAEAILEEVQLMPFTFCDPDDPNAVSAVSTASCTTIEGPGAEAGEARGHAVTPFDNVSDYAGASVSPITDIAGGAVPGLNGYSASITVTPTALGGIAASEVFIIDVTVDGPRNESFTLSGMRARYAPRATP